MNNSYGPSRDLLSAAQQAFQVGRVQEAEDLCRKALAQNNKNVAAMILLGTVCFRTGRTQPGMDLMRRVLSVEPNSFEANLYMGVIIGSGGAPGEAVAYAERAVSIRPLDTQALNSLARCHLGLGEFEQAITCFQRAIAVEKRVPDLYVGLGDALRQVMRDDEAVGAYTRAVELAPGIVTTYVKLGRLLDKRKQTLEAKSLIQRARAIKASDAQGLFQLARELYGAEFYDDAVGTLESAIKLDPAFAAAYGLLGTIYRELGRFKEARENLHKAVEIQPSLAHAYLDITSLSKIKVENQEFVERMESALMDRSVNMEGKCCLHYALGKANEDLGNYQKSMQHYDEANGLMLLQMGQSPFNKKEHSAYIDWVIKTFTPEFFEKHRQLGTDSDLPLLVVGMIRSGTTLVEQILSSHPDIAAAGERAFIRRTVDKVMRIGDTSPSHAGVELLSERYVQLLQSVDPNKKRVVDKMPHNFLYLGFVHLAFPNVRLVHIQRDPIDTCLSIYTTFFREPVDIAHDKATIMFFYREYLRLMDHWRRVLPADRFFELEYEQLVGSQEAVVQQLIEFTGLEWDEACLKHEDNESAIKTPSWWQARQPVYSTSVRRWEKFGPWLGDFKKLQSDSVLI